MADKGVVTISVGSISGLAIFIASEMEIDVDYREIIIALIPIAVSVLALIFEWCRLHYGWLSRQELKNRNAQIEHEMKYEKKIAICEDALKKDLTEEQKDEYRKSIHKYTQMKLMDVSVQEAPSHGKPDFS